MDKGLGADFENQLIDSIQKVSTSDISRVANAYIKDPTILTVLAPKEYLKGI